MVAAAYMGILAGLSLGPIYLAGGLGHAVEDHARAVRILAEARAEQAEEAREERLAALNPLGPPPGAVAAVATPAKATHARELDCLAQAVYFEARGETPRGQAAVATVVMNRVKNPRFPKTVCGVVYQGASHRNGCQFSFACDGIRQRVVEWGAWERARKIAAQTLSGFVLRDIGSATYYHTVDVSPEWGASMRRVAQVGLHVFYRFNPHAAPPVLEASTGDNDDASALLTAAAPRLDAAVTAPAAPTVQPAQPPAIAAPAPVKLPDTGALAKTADTASSAPAKAVDAT